MRLLAACVALSLLGCGANTAATAREQYRRLTEQQRPSFESPGDSVSLAPTPDTGIFGQGDPTHDCSSCPPR
jgi:hypothetical protein